MKRHIGIIIFVTLFISIVSIIAIFTARGYNFIENEVKSTGIINVESNPDNATIYVNGEKKGATPDDIELSEGIYEIEIQKDNYRAWRKELEIEPSVVNEITVKLFPIDLNLEQNTFVSIDNAFFSTDGSLMIYSVLEKPNTGIWLSKLEQGLFDISKPKSTKIASISDFPDTCFTNDYNLLISHRNDSALLNCKNGNTSNYYFINFNNKFFIRDLNEELDFAPDKVDFGLLQDNVLIIKNKTLSNYNLSSKKTTLLIIYLTDVIYSYMGKKLLVLNSSSTEKNIYTFSDDLTKEEIDIKTVDTSKIKTLYSSFNLEEYFVLTTGNDSYLYSINREKPYKITDSQINIYSWSPDGLAFLYEKKNRLYSLSINKYPNDSTKLKSSLLKNNYDRTKYAVDWSQSSDFLAVNDIEEKKIYSYDVDGTNKHLLYIGSLSRPEAFKLSENSTFLVLLIMDDNNFSNIYSINLRT